MPERFSLNPEDLQVQSYSVSSIDRSIGGGFSWPDVCTCIDICQPTEDLYCSGGCPPETTMPVVE
jgi:hypothetical protein